MDENDERTSSAARIREPDSVLHDARRPMRFRGHTHDALLQVDNHEGEAFRIQGLLLCHVGITATGLGAVYPEGSSGGGRARANPIWSMLGSMKYNENS